MSAHDNQRKTSAIALNPVIENGGEPSSSVQHRRKSLLRDASADATCLNTQQPNSIQDQPYPNNSADDSSAAVTRRQSLVSSILETVTGHRRRSSLGFTRLEEACLQQPEEIFRHSLRESQLLDVPLGPFYRQSVSSVYLNANSSEHWADTSNNNDVLMQPQQLLSRTPTIVSRPPSYKPYSTEERNLQRQQEWAAAIRLQQYYHREHRLQSGSRWLYGNIWSSDEADAQVAWKDGLTACFIQQFQGVHMAIWVVILTFVGAISVFLPGLASAVFALWLPLILYVVLSFFVLYHRKKRRKRIRQLESQVVQARERRIHELMSAVDLPENHYFVTEYRPDDHGHPVTTLLPPPPAYQQGGGLFSPTAAEERDSIWTHEEEDWQREHAEELAEDEERQQRRHSA